MKELRQHLEAALSRAKGIARSGNLDWERQMIIMKITEALEELDEWEPSSWDAVDHRVRLERRLREWRRQEAMSRSVPIYIVMPEGALRAIVETQPATLGDLQEIKGMGPRKTEMYGEDLLGVINAPK